MKISILLAFTLFLSLISNGAIAKTHKTQSPVISNATIEVIDVNSGVVRRTLTSNENGEFVYNFFGPFSLSHKKALFKISGGYINGQPNSGSLYLYHPTPSRQGVGLVASYYSTAAYLAALSVKDKVLPEEFALVVEGKYNILGYTNYEIAENDGVSIEDKLYRPLNEEDIIDLENRFIVSENDNQLTYALTKSLSYDMAFNEIDPFIVKSNLINIKAPVSGQTTVVETGHVITSEEMEAAGESGVDVVIDDSITELTLIFESFTQALDAGAVVRWSGCRAERGSNICSFNPVFKKSIEIHLDFHKKDSSSEGSLMASDVKYVIGKISGLNAISPIRIKKADVFKKTENGDEVEIPLLQGDLISDMHSGRSLIIEDISEDGDDYIFSGLYAENYHISGNFLKDSRTPTIDKYRYINDTELPKEVLDKVFVDENGELVSIHNHPETGNAVVTFYNRVTDSYSTSGSSSESEPTTEWKSGNICVSDTFNGPIYDIKTNMSIVASFKCDIQIEITKKVEVQFNRSGYLFQKETYTASALAEIASGLEVEVREERSVRIPGGKGLKAYGASFLTFSNILNYKISGSIAATRRVYFTDGKLISADRFELGRPTYQSTSIKDSFLSAESTLSAGIEFGVEASNLLFKSQAGANISYNLKKKPTKNGCLALEGALEVSPVLNNDVAFFSTTAKLFTAEVTKDIYSFECAERGGVRIESEPIEMTSNWLSTVRKEVAGTVTIHNETNAAAIVSVYSSLFPDDVVTYDVDADSSKEINVTVDWDIIAKMTVENTGTIESEFFFEVSGVDNYGDSFKVKENITGKFTYQNEALDKYVHVPPKIIAKRIPRGTFERPVFKIYFEKAANTTLPDEYAYYDVQIGSPTINAPIKMHINDSSIYYGTRYYFNSPFYAYLDKPNVNNNISIRMLRQRVSYRRYNEYSTGTLTAHSPYNARQALGTTTCTYLDGRIIATEGEYRVRHSTSIFSLEHSPLGRLKSFISATMNSPFSSPTPMVGIIRDKKGRHGKYQDIGEVRVSGPNIYVIQSPIAYSQSTIRTCESVLTLQ